MTAASLQVLEDFGCADKQQADSVDDAFDKDHVYQGPGALEERQKHPVDETKIDIVHVPRNAEDDLTENQCEDFRLGKVMHFIELDKTGSIVRIA